MFYLAWEPLLPGLYFHLLALWCVYSSVLYFPPTPRIHPPLPLSTTTMLPPSLALRVLPIVVSLLLYLSTGRLLSSLSIVVLPFVLSPSTPFLLPLSLFHAALPLPSLSCLRAPSPSSHHAFHSVVPTYSLALLLPDVCFSSLSLSATEPLAMGPIQFPSCNFQSIHKRLSRRKPSTDVRIIAVRSNN